MNKEPNLLEKMDSTATFTDEAPKGTFVLAGITEVAGIEYISLQEEESPLIALLKRDGELPHVILLAAAKFARGENFKVGVCIRHGKDQVIVDFLLPQDALHAWYRKSEE